MNQGQGSTINNNGFYPDNDSQLLSLDTTTIHQQQDYNHHHHHHQQQQQQQQQIIDLSTFDPELGLFTLWNNHNNHLRHLSENDVFHYASSDTFDKQRSLRFNITLEAATALTRKSEDIPITYLNRGQLYAIQLNDKQASKEVVTSTLSIEFHTPTHRRLAETHWTFWSSQQKNSNQQVIEVDSKESAGIFDIEFPSFDKVSFKWQSRYGAKVFVRFKCLSTDFSRTKGVKGVPLRLSMISQDSTMAEDSFCRIKLFRDKGAERKNKDDAKQISRQQEKKFGDVKEQSVSLLYNASLPFSTFQRLPDSTTSIDYTIDDLNVQSKTPARYHTRIMTAPTYNSPSTSAASLDYNQVTIDTNFFYPSIISTPALSEPDMFCLPFIDTQTPNDVLYTPISFPINNNNNVTTYMLNTDYFFQQQQQQQQHQDILTATPQFMKHNEQEDHSSNLTYLF